MEIQNRLAKTGNIRYDKNVRDLFYDLTHWEDTAEHRWQLMLDLVAVLPLIGAVKNAGKAGELAQEVLRHGDEISSVLNALPSGADEAAELIGDIAKHSDEAADLARDALKNEDEIQAIINQVFDEEDEFGKTIRNTLDDEDDWLADVTEGAGDAGIKPYSTSRPKYGRTQVDDVWNAHANPETGTVTDPSGATIVWDRAKPRNGQWDMGHIPGQKYSDTYARYMNGELSLDEFLKWYRNPQNYRPELPGTNRSHLYEDNWPYLK